MAIDPQILLKDKRPAADRDICNKVVPAFLMRRIRGQRLDLTSVLGDSCGVLKGPGPRRKMFCFLMTAGMISMVSQHARDVHEDQEKPHGQGQASTLDRTSRDGDYSGMSSKISAVHEISWDKHLAGCYCCSNLWKKRMSRSIWELAPTRKQRRDEECEAKPYAAQNFARPRRRHTTAGPTSPPHTPLGFTCPRYPQPTTRQVVLHAPAFASSLDGDLGPRLPYSGQFTSINTRVVCRPTDVNYGTIFGRSAC